MSSITLRPRKNRTDYAKMASGDTSDEENGNEYHERPDENKNKNKPSMFDNGDGGILGEEIFNHDDSLEEGECSSSSSAVEEEVSDLEIEAVEEKLKRMKLEEERLKKAEKYRRLSQEAEKVERSIKALKKKKAVKGKIKVTNVELRGMKDVMGEVDKIMDEKVKRTPKFESSSSSDETQSIRKSKNKKVKAERYKKEEELTSGFKSGKSKRSSSSVKLQEDWPHTYLGLHFVNQKEKDYEELTLAEFCAGYAAILEECDGELLTNRISHFKELMYLATKFQWRNVLSYHGAVLFEIERGHLKWGDNFQVLQNTTLAGGLLTSQPSRGFGSAPGANFRRQDRGNISESQQRGIVFCKAYTNGVCPQTGDHLGDYKGESRMLKHICGNCWMYGRKMAAHPEISEVCPYFQQNGS